MQATAWAVQREADILAGKGKPTPDCDLREVLERYALQVSTKKRGTLWEQRRIDWFKTHLPWVLGSKRGQRGCSRSRFNNAR